MNLKRLLKGCFTVLFMFVLTITILIFMINVIFKRNRQPEVNFRELYLEDTIPLAQRTAKKYGLFPSVMIAQSILESNWGRSQLSTEYNNYFGVKATLSDDSIRLETEEYVNGESGRYLESFRKYKSKKESFEHYAKLLTEAKRYDKVKTAMDFREAAVYINQGGYATDPNYADKIISIIEKYNLGQYD